MLRIAIVVLGLFGLVGCAGESGISFPSKVPEGMSATTLRGRLFKPDGPGPFPAVVVLHGCSGVSRHHDDWSRRLNDWGYVALVVDSLGPRGYQSVCNQGTAVPPSERARDAFGAAAYLRTLPEVRADRIGAIGFSHGGWTVMRLVQANAPNDAGATPFQAAVAYYPWCDGLADRDAAVPTLVLIGDLDDWTPAARCRQLQPLLKQPDLVSMTFYPNAYHGFDFQSGTRYTAGARGEMHRQEYDRDAAPDSFARAYAFLDRYLKP